VTYAAAALLQFGLCDIAVISRVTHY